MARGKKLAHYTYTALEAQRERIEALEGVLGDIAVYLATTHQTAHVARLLQQIKELKIGCQPKNGNAETHP